MRRTVTLLLAALVATTTLHVAAPTASAEASSERNGSSTVRGDSKGCVSEAEVAALERGVTRARTHRLIGTRGRVVERRQSGYVADMPTGQSVVVHRFQQVRVYPGCDTSTEVVIGFVKKTRDGHATPYRLTRKRVRVS